MTAFNYPPSPGLVPAEKLNPSATFRKQAAKVITSIVLFFIVYLLLIAAAIVLAIVLCYLGIQLIIALPKFITLVAGFGMVAVGVSVIFFLIKFVFAVSRNENLNRIEITEREQPELFEFIRKLSKETRTAFPKKIFISPDVNACVFYNSSFWSMLLPVRKNLEIGLGLVNSINISELKAVIAHEFGHFSQRSMKLGSFTYNVNKVIYNMLYENNSYTSFLNTWGKLHGILSFFASITVKIAQGIQYILRAMYQLINKNYMSLSREMEFHADAIAASAAGGNNVISGLSRIELAAGSYNTTLTKAHELLKENKRMANVFNSQLTVFRTLASRFKLPIKEGLPEISFDFIRSFSTSRINYKNQWASHPELHERKAHLETLNINVPADESPAWIVFENPEQLQEQVTEKLYSQVKTEQSLQIVDSSVFDNLYNKETEEYALPAAYKGYYDGRYIDISNWNINNLLKGESSTSFNSLFTKENAQLQASINNSRSDIETLKAIRDKQIDAKSFDFDGVKHGSGDCDAIIQQLEKEISAKQEQLRELDKEAFILFTHYSPDIGPAYINFKAISEKFDSYSSVVNDLLEAMQPLYKGGFTLEQVQTIVRRIKNVHEKHLKEKMDNILAEGIISREKNETLFYDVKSFMEKDYVYFANNKFMNDELSSLSDIAIHTANAYHDYKFKQYKKLLEKQVTTYESSLVSSMSLV